MIPKTGGWRGDTSGTDVLGCGVEKKRIGRRAGDGRGGSGGGSGVVRGRSEIRRSLSLLIHRYFALQALIFFFLLSSL